MSEEERELRQKDSTKGTFVVTIQRNDNATWEGSVLWTQKDIRKNFRSALELLKLIDGAIESEK